MHVHQLSACVIRVPLPAPLRHGRQESWHSDNLVVRCELRGRRRKPIIGWGEGVPSGDVAGDTAEGALALLAASPIGEQLEGSPANWSEVVTMVDRFQPPRDQEVPRGSRLNALRCAVELSLLDAYGKFFGEPVSNALRQLPDAASLIAPRSEVEYSTTIDAMHRRRVGTAAVKTRLYGFKQCKVNIAGRGGHDARLLAKIREGIGPHVDLRLDVNGTWHADQLLDRLNRLRPFDISCLEQPLDHAELDRLPELYPQIGIPVMLDQSLTSEADARRAIELGVCDLFNIQLSKCGGLIASARLAALAHRHGLGYQIGCHPGETDLLTAAGRHLATTLSGYWYLEAANHRHTFGLRTPLTRHDMTFGYGGRAPRITRPGLGTEFVPRRLHRRIVARSEVQVVG